MESNPERPVPNVTINQPSTRSGRGTSARSERQKETVPSAISHLGEVSNPLNFL
jgi:hypothetical protein